MFPKNKLLIWITVKGKISSKILDKEKCLINIYLNGPVLYKNKSITLKYISIFIFNLIHTGISFALALQITIMNASAKKKNC